MAFVFNYEVDQLSSLPILWDLGKIRGSECDDCICKEEKDEAESEEEAESEAEAEAEAEAESEADGEAESEAEAFQKYHLNRLGISHTPEICVYIWSILLIY